MGVFQSLAGMVSGPWRSSEPDLFLRQLPVGLAGVSSAGWCSSEQSAVGRAVPPRSGRLLGRSLEKNSVTDLERFLRLTASEETRGLSGRRAGEPRVSPGTLVCRHGDKGLVPRRGLLAGREAMLFALLGLCHET
jgi:hypothetical protein